MQTSRSCIVLLVLALAAALAGGCGTNATLLNPAFVNFTQGGVIPLAPGQASGFVLVRLVNRTENAIEFIVTVEREPAADGDGDATGPLVGETFRLTTFSGGLTNENGILVNCPVVRIGLGEDLNFPEDEPGLFIGTGNTDPIIQGFGVPGRVNPLDARAGNFTCGDTVIFEVNPQVGVPGNVRVRTYVLPAADQPTEFSGPDTFNNARELLNRELGGGS